MIRFDVKVKLDENGIIRDIEKKRTYAQKLLDSEVLRGSNYFIPKQTGALENSGISSTVIGSGLIKWTTDYARKQYYGNYSHDKSRNPNATGRWFEAAKARWGKAWEKLVNECFRTNK